jgi:hypothetical protein
MNGLAFSFQRAFLRLTFFLQAGNPISFYLPFFVRRLGRESSD